MATKIQFRRDTAANWAAVPTTVLASGEIGYETDTGNIKIGDGTTQWQNLVYYQLPNVSVNPVTTSDLNNAAYRVMGRYRLNTVTSGMTLTNGPSDLDAADSDSVCTLIVTTHAYSALSTHVQQTLTQFSASGTTLKQWVRLYNGTNWTAWTSTAHLTDGEVTTAKIADDAVTAAKLADSTSTDANRAVTTDHIRDSAVTTAKIANSNVTFAKLPDSAAAGLSVVGRSANSAGNFAEIAAGTDGHVLRRSGTALGFGTVATAGIGDSQVTTAKLADDAVTSAKFLAPQVVYVESLTTASYTMATLTTNSAEGALEKRVELAALTASITPRASTHKVMVKFEISGEGDNESSGNFGHGFVVTRKIGTGADSLICIPSATGLGSRMRFTTAIAWDGDTDSTPKLTSMTIVDSPATTSEVTYKVWYYAWDGTTAGKAFRLNRTFSDTDSAQHERMTSRTILQEIYA